MILRRTLRTPIDVGERDSSLDSLCAHLVEHVKVNHAVDVQGRAVLNQVPASDPVDILDYGVANRSEIVLRDDLDKLIAVDHEEHIERSGSRQILGVYDLLHVEDLSMHGVQRVIHVVGMTHARMTHARLTHAGLTHARLTHARLTHARSRHG